MAIELLFEDNINMRTPRISFSYDHCQSGCVPIDQGTLRSNSSGSARSEFYFPVDTSFNQEYSSADELFCDGKLLPVEIKSSCPSKRMCQPATPLDTLKDDVQNSKDGVLEEKIIRVDQRNKSQSSKSFWTFKRSRSMGCTSTLCPLLLLSRSSSTGTAPEKEIARVGKDVYKNNPKKISSLASMNNTSELSSLMNNQRPPLKKNYKSLNKGGIPVSPVLNVSSGNMFGLGSLFNGRAKCKK